MGIHHEKFSTLNFQVEEDIHKEVIPDLFGILNEEGTGGRHIRITKIKAMIAEIQTGLN